MLGRIRSSTITCKLHLAQVYELRGLTVSTEELALNQILAIEKGIKTRSYAEATRLHKLSSSPTPMNGQERNYVPTAEDEVELPPERQIVQMTYQTALDEVEKAWRELWNITATKDFGNCHARADVIIGGEVIVAGAPATFLLSMEKQLGDVQTFVEKLVELDPAEDWSYDDNTGLSKTGATQAHRTRKVPQVLTLAPPTEHHPAQVHAIEVNQIVGHWNTIKFSGAIPRTKKRELAARVEQLLRAVKQARERANMTPVVRQKAGAALLAYIFGT